jgi:hypothetical protein
MSKICLILAHFNTLQTKNIKFPTTAQAPGTNPPTIRAQMLPGAGTMQFNHRWTPDEHQMNTDKTKGERLFQSGTSGHH